MCENFDPVCSTLPSWVSMYVCTHTQTHIHTYTCPLVYYFSAIVCVSVFRMSACVCVCACVCMWATKLKVCFSQRWGQNCPPPLPTPSGTKATSCLCSSHMTLWVCVCMCMCLCVYMMCVCVSVWLDKVLGYFLLFNCFSCCCHSRVTAELREKLSALLVAYPSPSISPCQSCEMLLCCCSSSIYCCCCCYRAHCHRLSTRLRLLLCVVYLTTFGLTVNEANWKLPDCCEHTRTIQYGQINEFTLQYDSTQL